MKGHKQYHIPPPARKMCRPALKEPRDGSGWDKAQEWSVELPQHPEPSMGHQFWTNTAMVEHRFRGEDRLKSSQTMQHSSNGSGGTSMIHLDRKLVSVACLSFTLHSVLLIYVASLTINIVSRSFTNPKAWTYASTKAMVARKNPF